MSVPATAQSPVDEELTDPSGMVGRVLADRYKVTGLLGVGGIGRVYRAEHLVLKRSVALKVLLEHYQCVPELQRRFEREAMALAALSHPNIVTITDFVASRDATFLVMELVEGRDLDEVLEDGPLPPADAFAVMEQLLGCLAYAHQHDVIHRDLKPQNVLVQTLPGERIHAVVLDFGLAKFMDGSGPSANLTKTGLIVGTPAYMAPEQASGAHADKRADVYAAGIMLFEMLAGVHPFEGFEGQELLRQHLLAPAPTLASKSEGARVAPALEELLARALAKDGVDRFADGAAMLDAFLELPRDAFVRGSETSSTPRVRTSAPTAVAATKPAVPALVSQASTRRRGRLVVGAVVMVAMAAVAWAIYATITPPAPGTEPRAEARGSAATAVVEPSAAGSDTTQPPAGTDDGAEDPAGADDAAGDDAAGDDAAGEDAAGDDGDDAEATEADLEAAADDVVDDGAEDEAVIGAGDPEPPPDARPAARNPWRGRTPEALSRLRRRIDRGNPITRGHVRALRQYRRRNPRDVRATLLLGQAYVSRGALTGALTHYRRAHQIDQSARGDADMRRDIVRMAGTEALHDDATHALIEIYGREAIASVRRAAARERDAEEKARLEDTLARLRAAVGE